jgi:Secretion system C-terminal sorting domain
MKRILLLTIVMCMALAVSAQSDVLMHKKVKVIATRERNSSIDLPIVGHQPPNNYVSNKSIMDDPVTCITRYDLQTNYSNQRRIFLHPDRTIGTVATWSTQDASWTDRGSGYNYFDGTSWGAQPTQRIEAVRAGWGEYLPFEADGEMIIAHEATGPLVINKRVPKGTGAWTQTLMPALPSNITGMFWPRTVTNGPNHTNIHIIAMTLPTGNGGQVYNGMDGALLYSQSLDGGTTWTNWTQLPGTSGTDYTNFTADTYAWAEPHGDTLAFTEGFSFQDQILMKSTDNGTTWTKTIIYHSPYNLGGSSPHFFYCPDGTTSIALDRQGNAHVVFGLMNDSIVDGSTTYNYYPFTEGIVYWNEHMPQLVQSLDPNILIPNHQYVAWVKDTNVFQMPATQLSFYYTSLTSHPELVIDWNNKIFLVWAGETTLIDPNGYSLRHLFGRDALINSTGDVVWHNDSLVDITGDWIQYNFAECMYPSASTNSDDNIYILFQRDDYGGSYVESIGRTYQGQTTPNDNSMTVIKWQKPVWVGVNEKHEKPTFSVGQNLPNPFNGLTKVNVYLQNAGGLSLKVTNLTGQVLMSMEKTNVLPGVSQFVIDGSQLSSGIYFYTVKQGNQSITKKMVIQ